MRLDTGTLDRTPGEGARVVALALCAIAEEATRRVGKKGDEEALHDLRVALRRLRSALRAWGPALAGVVRDEDRRRLGRLSRATGPARDAEVLLRWLEGLRDGVPAAWRGALEWLASRVEAARQDGYAAVEQEVAPRFAELAPALARQLAAGGEPAPAPGGAGSFGAALAGLARAQARTLKEALAAVTVPADVAEAHRARIEAKRLRYLVEPLRGNARADAGPAVKSLKALQDLLGAMHDAHRAEAEVGAALVVAAAERALARRGEAEEAAELRPGLLGVQGLARERAAALFRELEERWRGPGLAGALDQVFEVVAALEWRDAEEAEPERRLLLGALPPEAEGRDGEREESEQGWLADGRESYGVVRGPGDGERWFRSTVQGRGARRFEVVEEISRGEFEAYWPLTEGRRLRKRRHRPAGEAGWCFDEFPERKVVLAVSVEGGGAVPPPWLEPHLVRDVTGERGYADEALARRTVKGRG